MLEDVAYTCAGDGGGCKDGIKLYWTADVEEGLLKLRAQSMNAAPVWLGFGLAGPLSGGMAGGHAFVARQPDGSGVSTLQLAQCALLDDAGARF
jgi:hypothetical protein